MLVVLVVNELLVYGVGLDTLCTVPPREQRDEIMLELSREIGDVSASVLTHDEHLSEMRFGLDVTFETVVVSTLFLADLTVPS